MGQTDYWLVYISIGNIHNNVWHAHSNGIMLLGFLAIPKSEYIMFIIFPNLKIFYR